MTVSWRPKFMRQAVNVLKEKQVFSGFSQVKEFSIQFPLFDGGISKILSRELVCRPSAIAALLYDSEQDCVVMIEEFRIGAVESESPWLLEIVAGMIEKGDRPEETALREIEEETGCHVLSLIPICSYFTTPGISNERIFVYCARVNAPLLGGVHGMEEEGEDITVHVFPTEEAFRLLEEGVIVSSPAVIALQWLKIHRATLI